MTDWNSVFDGILTERQFKVNEPMNRHNTYGIGGPADVFVMPQTEDQLKQVLRRADELHIPVTVIGGGSNSLISDRGIRGITLCTARIKSSTVRKGNQIIVTGGAGTGAVSRFAMKEGLSGLEFAAGIPGTLLGAVFMNANGYGSKFANVVHSVRTVTRDGRQEKHYTLEEIQYGDSDSVFMHNGDIVLEVVFDLKEGNPEEIKAVMDEYQASRRAKQPLEKRSAGTMFLRPTGHYVGPMIKGCDLMGFAIGDSQVSTKHPDFVVNNGKASAADILAVLHEVQRRVQEKYHVHLPLDVRMMGEDFPQE